jgi:hypothetical protein
MAPLYANCPDCRANATHGTRQRKLGRAFQPKWRAACAAHAPSSNQWHETLPIGQAMMAVTTEQGIAYVRRRKAAAQ